jgi:hypothetical protein
VTPSKHLNVLFFPQLLSLIGSSVFSDQGVGCRGIKKN